MDVRNLLKHSDLIFLSVLSFFTRFWRLSYPPNVVFDETYFGLFATKYFSHQYYFDIHPPLGKLILALSGFLNGIRPGFDFKLGDAYGDFHFLALRALPAFLGSCLVLIIYLLVKEMGFSRRAAFLSAFLLLFDNALLVQSRFILLDVILLFFIFLPFYLFLLAKRFSPLSFKWYFLNILTGLCLGAAISIKWTGFGILGAVWFIGVFKDNIFSSFKKENLIKIGLLFIAPFLIYFSIFALHFYLLSSVCTKDCGAVLGRGSIEESDVAFYNTPPTGNLIVKFLRTNGTMLASNISFRRPFYAQSDWFSWPFMIRPIPYFTETQADNISRIYFFGNPFVWWLGMIGVLGYFYLMARNYLSKFKFKLPQSFYSPGCEFLILGYLVYLIPFASIQRFMLMYHYLPALVFSVIIFSVFFEGLLKMIFKFGADDKFLFPNKKANLIFFSILFLVLASFLFFSPLTYGFPLNNNEFKARMWFDIWNFNLP